MNILSVGLGGIIGAILRYITGQVIPVQNGFPLNTLMINLSGCFLLAWFYTTVIDRNIPSYIRLGIGTGLIGAFTTFSTFSVETIELLRHGQWFQALLYVLISVIGGLLLSVAGMKWADFLQRSKGGQI
nr:fluoride efflux transporter CrcB [uncultured Bacillus sp.]